MGTEVERKFLLADETWRDQVTRSKRISQGYLSRGDGSSVRVRISDGTGTLNIKSTRDGVSRLEFEYEIPLADAEQIMEQVALRPRIDKTRHIVEFGAHTWEIDEFSGDNDGLVMAEVELTHADEAFERPAWLGDEVSHDRRYYNNSLIDHPFKDWA